MTRGAVGGATAPLRSGLALGTVRRDALRAGLALGTVRRGAMDSLSSRGGAAHNRTMALVPHAKSRRGGHGPVRPHVPQIVQVRR
jgi:hypothetical protein